MSKIAQYANIIDRNLDRWETAIEAARAATYTPGQFAQDVAESWTDWALYAALPLSSFGLDISVRAAVPTVEFIVIDKTVALTKVVKVPQINNVTAAASQNLSRPGATAIAPFIPNSNVSATLAGTEHLYVTLDVPGIAALTRGPGPLSADVYTGDIKGMPANVTIAYVRVIWPG